MEYIYLLAFRINLLMDDHQLTNEFVHVISEKDFSLSLGEELIVRDLLKMYEHEHLFLRLTFWS